MGVVIKEVYLPKDENTYTKMAIFTYEGEGDPVEHIDEAVSKYTLCLVDENLVNRTRTTNGCRKPYNEFVDINMNNPWVRIVTAEFNKDEMRDDKLKVIIK